jgi:hypothetical protein
MPDLLTTTPETDMSTTPAPPDLATPSPDLTVLPMNVGDPCVGACGAGLTCMSWVPTGYCSKSCTGDGDCPGNASCVDIGNGNLFCLLDAGGGCMRSELSCRDCGHEVCGPKSFCSGC